MKFVIIIILIVFALKSFGQNAPVEDRSVKFHAVTSIATFIDSVRAKAIADTSKFNKSDVLVTSIGFVNKKSYSSLFFINMLYKYKLDIINGDDVVSFLNEILVVDKIQSITLLEEPKSLEIFGPHGKNGIIIIEMKEISTVNLNVAGFKAIRTVGDNFH